MSLRRLVASSMPTMWRKFMSKRTVSRLFVDVLIIALVLAFIGAMTGAPPIFFGVVGGVLVCIYAFWVILKEKSELKATVKREEQTRLGK
jgi:uncharacterized membrane protein YfcA